MNPEPVKGRFLPSRIYNRWKWTVRLGLLIVPFIMLMFGGITLFLSPNRYRSTTTFEITNGPSPRETEELVRSEGVLERVSAALDLPRRLGLDTASCVHTIRECSTVKLLKDTRMVRVRVTLTRNIDARDIADEIPQTLVRYLAETLQRQNEEKLAELASLIRNAEDIAQERVVEVAKLESIHGPQPEENAAATALRRARRASLLADAEMERLEVLRHELLRENIERIPRLTVHTRPMVAESPVSPETGEEINKLVFRSLASGLLVALLIPYLLELAFPPSCKGVAPPDSAADL